MSSSGWRLNRYLAAAGVCSRRKADELIRSGRVSVNGSRKNLIGKTITENDQVDFDGERVLLENTRFFLFHKPRNVITSLDDQQGRKSIEDFLGDVAERVFPVGRLDWDVNGILILTNHGALAQELAHPSFEISRQYLALVKGEVAKKTLNRLTAGLELEDGPGRALEVQHVQDSALTESLTRKRSPKESLLALSVGEGRNHFVKRLLAEVGHPVILLSRTHFGPFALMDLPSGALRELSVDAAKKRLADFKENTHQSSMS